MGISTLQNRSHLALMTHQRHQYYFFKGLKCPDKFDLTFQDADNLHTKTYAKPLVSVECYKNLSLAQKQARVLVNLSACPALGKWQFLLIFRLGLG